MLKNYFNIAIRNMMKHKFFSAINVLGMTIGITSCLMIVLYVSDEFSYDRFHAKADRIYQVGLHARIGGQDITTATTCPPLAEGFVKEIPGVEEATRIADFWGERMVKYEDKAFNQDKIYYADSNFFSFFSFKLIEGEPKTALLEPNTVVLTQSVAVKYFGTEPALGKLLTIGREDNAYKVTGVTEDCPTNSHFVYNILLSSSSAERLKGNEWLNNYLHSYFVLNEETPVTAVEEKSKDLIVKYVGPELERFIGVPIKQMESQGGTYGYFATPLTDIHLRSKTQHDMEPGGNIQYVYFFTAIGVFIIFIACINFMNLSTARSAGRAKEVGLRKTLGSLRGQMVGQFLAESMLYSLITVVLSVGLCYLMLPQFNLLSGKQLGMDVLVSPVFMTSLAALVVLVGLLAGSYPAFYLTSFNVVEVLKGKVRSGLKSKGVRSTLVVFQFALSIFLIIFTVVVYQQIHFMQDRNMGIDKHNVLVLNSSRLGNNVDAFKNALEQQKGIVKSSYTNNSFPGVNSTTVFKSSVSDQDHIMGVYQADYDHQEVMRFELKEGRYFSKDFPSDNTSAILLNEAAVEEFGFTNPLQEDIIYNNIFGDSARVERLRIIGVFKDFNFESLKMKVRPLAIRLTDKSNKLMIRYEGNATETVATIEKLWKQHAANEPFDYDFLDQDFDSLFRSEQRMGELFSVFSVLAIFIACLGLFALAAFTAEQRTKEIGIRKAMGASTTGLTILLSKEFTLLVIIAFVPAAGLAWWALDQWLDGFVYHIPMSPLVFIGSGVAAIVIAWFTVGFQSIKAAASNPVDSLRYE